MAKKIVDVKRDQNKNTDFKTSDGKWHTKKEALKLAKQDKLKDVNVSKTKDGKEYIRKNRNGKTDDNLDNL